MTSHQGVNNDGRANQRQRHESEADFWTGKILGRDRADLRADGGAGVHNERDQNVHIAFHSVGERSVTGGDDDLEKIGPDSEVGGDSQYVNHRRHSDVTGAAAQKTAKEPAYKRDQNDDPE